MPEDPKKRRNTQISGNVALYYSCYRLSRLGWNVMPTARNAKGVDIFAYNHDATNLIGIQVKGLSDGRSDGPLGSSVDALMGHFWIIVNKIATETPTAFILLPSEIQANAVRNEKNGKASYWLPRRYFDCDEFREAWHRIGRGGV